MSDTNEKKSFLLYFDMHRQLAALSDQQRGELLLALFEFAEQEAKRPGSGDSVLAAHPDLTGDTRMAYLFITQTIQRDTDKWREKRLRYQQAAKTRSEQQRSQSRPGGTEHPNTELRQYVQALHRENEI